MADRVGMSVAAASWAGRPSDRATTPISATPMAAGRAAEHARGGQQGQQRPARGASQGGRVAFRCLSSRYLALSALLKIIIVASLAEGAAMSAAMSAAGPWTARAEISGVGGVPDTA